MEDCIESGGCKVTLSVELCSSWTMGNLTRVLDGGAPLDFKLLKTSLKPEAWAPDSG